MSVKVMSRVWENSKAQAGALLVLLAIADFADDDGLAWPSVPMLAQKARLGKRQIHRVLRHLERNGEIALRQGQGPGGRNLYSVLIPGGVSKCHPCQNVTPVKMSPVTSVTPPQLFPPSSLPLSPVPPSPPPSSLPSLYPSVTESPPIIPPFAKGGIPQPNFKEPWGKPKWTIPQNGCTPRTASGVSEAFVARMVQEHAESLSEVEVQTSVALALSHQMAKRYLDLESYVRWWLFQAADRKGNKNGRSPRRKKLLAKRTDPKEYLRRW